MSICQPLRTTYRTVEVTARSKVVRGGGGPKACGTSREQQQNAHGDQDAVRDELQAMPVQAIHQKVPFAGIPTRLPGRHNLELRGRTAASAFVSAAMHSDKPIRTIRFAYGQLLHLASRGAESWRGMKYREDNQ